MKRNTFVLLFCSLCVGTLVASCAPPVVEPDGQLSKTPQVTDSVSQSGTSSITEGDLAQTKQRGMGQDSLSAHQAGVLPDPGVLVDVLFDFDRSELKPMARDVLQRNSDWIKQNLGVGIEIEGHADSRGTNEYNLALGSRRAQAVKDYLVTLGNAPGRLSTISYGEELPVCGVNSEKCWEKNRRAHFVVRPPKPAS